jgi:hypothetical protein
VLDVLAQALGVGSTGRAKSNGLARLAGQWSDDEHETFERANAATEQIDQELWR